MVLRGDYDIHKILERTRPVTRRWSLFDRVNQKTSSSKQRKHTMVVRHLCWSSYFSLPPQWPSGVVFLESPLGWTLLGQNFETSSKMLICHQRCQIHFLFHAVFTQCKDLTLRTFWGPSTVIVKDYLVVEERSHAPNWWPDLWTLQSRNKALWNISPVCYLSSCTLVLIDCLEYIQVQNKLPIYVNVKPEKRSVKRFSAE